MSPITRHSTLPSRRGEADAQNYKNRVRKQLAKHLRDKIGEKDIITGEGKLRVPVKGTKRYRFILDRGPGEEGPGGGGAGLDPGEEMYEVWLDMTEVEEILFQELDLPRLKPKQEVEAETSEYKYDTFAKKGPQVDKKSTLKRNMLRNSVLGQPGIGDFDNDDLRYISYHDKPVPKSKAVIFLCMDVSGSMGEFHKRIARLFFYWTVRFLRYRYDTVDIRFIAHHTTAREVTEHEFFNRTESGGTMVSSAYKLVQEIQRQYYSTNDWNIYVLHASDGDNWQLDNEDCFAAIKSLCEIASLVGYLEIRQAVTAMGNIMTPSWSTLIDDLGAKKDELGEEFMLTQIKSDEEIWGALKLFFARDNVLGAIAA